MPHPQTSPDRHVAALSAQLVSPSADAAAAHRDALLSRARRTLEAAGARFEPSLPSEILAVFRPPHTDDETVAALRAAIALHREAAALSANNDTPPPSLRIGVHSVAAPGHARDAALRRAADVARKLAAAAADGAVRVSADVERAAGHRFRFRHTPVEGAEDAVETAGEIETRTHYRDDARTPTVGREPELARLFETFERGSGGFLLVEGDAGIGKSRLVAEFRRRLEERGARATVASGRAHEGPQGPLDPFADIVRAAVGVTGLDPRDGERVAAWAAGNLEAALPEPIERENCAHFIALSLGFSLKNARVTAIEPARLRPEIHYAWVRFLRALAARQPLVVCLEDLQWADDATISVLESLAAGLAGEPVTFVGTRRPSARTPRGFERMRLAELSREASAELAAGILRAPLSDDLAEFLFQQSGGHPFFLEELARWVLESGLVSGNPLRLTGKPVGLPEGIQGLLAARIESLGPEDREVLKAASVVGNVFWSGLLEQAIYRKIDRALDRARRRQIVVARPRSLVPGDVEFAFRHAMLRDAAYSLLSPRERARLHRVVGDLLERHLAAGGRRVRALVAVHREAAGLREEPARLWQEAAEDALRESSYAEAVSDAREALRLGRGPAARLVAARALFRLARLDEAMEEARTVAASPDASAEEIARAKLLLAEMHGRRGDFATYLSLSEEVAAGNPPGRILVDALVGQARALWATAKYDAALQCVEEARARQAELLSPEEDREAARRAADLASLEGLVCWKQGRLTQASTAFQRALDTARRIGDRLATAAALNSIGALFRDRHNDLQARAAFEEAIGILRGIGDRIGIASTLGNLGMAHREAGALAESAAAHRESIAVFRDAGDVHAVARGLKSLSDALLDGGEFAAAREALEEALSLARKSGDRTGEMLALRNLGQIHAATGEGALAREEFERALEMSRDSRNAYNEAFILVRLGELHADAGRVAEAASALDAALRSAETHRIPELAVAARLARGRLRATLADPGSLQDARDALATATSPAQEAAALALLARVEAAADPSSAKFRLDRAAALPAREAALLDRLRQKEDAAAARAAIGESGRARAELAEALRLAGERGAREAESRIGRQLKAMETQSIET